ncbi:MAG: Uma2 family endonuclease [Cyclobacteriaceae bacterium]
MIEVAKRLINREEYYKMAEVGILKSSDHVELINGEIIEMSPIGSRHAGAVRRMGRILTRYLNESVDISIQSPIVLNDLSEPEPDIAILKFRADDYTESHPTAADIEYIIEVANTTLAYDLGVKSNLYAQASIPIYWVVDLERLEVTVYSNIFEGHYSKSEVLSTADEIEFLGSKISLSHLMIS